MVVTGACDNPDVLDKEAGALALRAFISLHEATGDEQWVAPARQAATFVETAFGSNSIVLDPSRKDCSAKGSMTSSVPKRICVAIAARQKCFPNRLALRKPQGI